MRTKSHVIYACCLLLVLSGCMTDRVQPVKEYPGVPKQSAFLVKKIDYDRYGRPLFHQRITRRPGSAGKQFTLVHAVDNRPVRSYDIALVEQKPNVLRPLEVVYEWTGKGYEAGVTSGRFFVSSLTVDVRGNRAAGTVQVGGALATMVVFTAAGFVIGLVASVPATMQELRNVVVNARETVIGYTVYEYDEKNRIKFVKLFPPIEHAGAIVKTEFFYEGGSDDPSKTEVTSVLENKVRIIQ